MQVAGDIALNSDGAIQSRRSSLAENLLELCVVCRAGDWRRRLVVVVELDGLAAFKHRRRCGACRTLALHEIDELTRQFAHTLRLLFSGRLRAAKQRRPARFWLVTLLNALLFLNLRMIKLVDFNKIFCAPLLCSR